MTDEPVRPSRSLLVRTTLVLAGALGLALALLFLFFPPYLSDAFRTESAGMLEEHEVRTREEVRVDADAVESVLRAGVGQAFEASEGVVADTPLELVTDDADVVRGALAPRITDKRREAGRKITAVAAEIRERHEKRLREVVEQTAAERRAEAFGRDLALRVASLLLALIALVFLVHGVLLYRGVLAPVRRLSEATHAVARGRLGTRLEVAGDDEVARLAGSFNEMTESLEQAHGDLTALNATLEDRVREQTAALRAALDESREANKRLEAAMQELRTKERELRQAEKMASLGTLAGGVAHEFNNLLGGILGCAEDAAREDDAGELKETLGVIERTARRGTAITENLLRFARPSEGRRGMVDVAEVARDVATLVEPEAARNRVSVDVVTNGATEVYGDGDGLHQVLLNLATNAIHAMREDGGTLRIRVRSDDRSVYLDVEDTGVGVAPDVRDQLFEPFFTTRGPEGTGLGLSVSYGIVRSHGGTLDVESEPGRGARFTVTLPAESRPKGADET